MKTGTGRTEARKNCTVHALILNRTMAIHPTAIIADDAKIDPSVEIGPFCIIESDVEIGEGTVLESSCRIYS